jgi:hypothetical protein
MSEYTIQFQRSDDEGDSWTPFGEAETLEDVTDIRTSLDHIAADADIDLPEASTWRIWAWPGSEVGDGTNFEAESGPWMADTAEDKAWALQQLPEELSPDRLLAELEELRDLVQAGIERRDRVVRVLMTIDAKVVKVPRARIAAAAGVSEPRLYQIRDGRR